jgi:MazG family protein
MDGLNIDLPALLYAEKVQKRAARVGFDWPDVAPVFEKVREELSELSHATPERQEEELGDVLFSVVNLARKLNINPEVALAAACRKFERRFRAIEQAAGERGQEIGKMSLAESDVLWNEAKSGEKLL